MDKQALLYIVTPISLLFIVYLLVLTVTWPFVRRHTFVPLYLLILLMIFPPAFFVFIFWFYIIHLGFMSSRYYIYETNTLPTEVRSVPSVPSQRQRRI